MTTHKADIVIFGAGIAGLWLHHRLRKAGYNSLLLEINAIGSGQTIASQGIIHSGLKYAFSGKIGGLTKSISAMPDLWRAALKGQGPVDLSKAKVNADSQYLLIPGGLLGGLVKLVAKQALGDKVRELAAHEWPEHLRASGFKGSVVFMNEPVLDVPSVLRALAEPYTDSIRKIEKMPEIKKGARGQIDSILIESHEISASAYIFTSAGSNTRIAARLGHDAGLQTQARPLVMGMMRGAPYELYAHCVGTSDKPVATITTHKDKNGALIWYLGGLVAERALDANPKEVIAAAREAFGKYLPQVDLKNVQWAVLPIDRIEGKSATQGWMPDTPTIHSIENAHYAWPTKLTFAPLLSDMILEKLAAPIDSATTKDWSFLPPASISATPWDTAQWLANSKKEN